jgi:hypothetical protein
VSINEKSGTSCFHFEKRTSKPIDNQQRDYQEWQQLRSLLTRENPSTSGSHHGVEKTVQRQEPADASHEQQRHIKSAVLFGDFSADSMVSFDLSI